MDYDYLCGQHGVETPAQIAAEIARERAEMAELEAAFGPYVFPSYMFPDLPF